MSIGFSMLDYFICMYSQKRNNLVKNKHYSSDRLSKRRVPWPNKCGTAYYSFLRDLQCLRDLQSS